MRELLVLCIAQPLHYAIYDDDVLVDSATISERASLALPLLYQRLNDTPIHAIYYASGPGNLSALKLTHTFLHSWSILESIPLYATDSFTLLPQHYIYAYGKRYFIQQIQPKLTKNLAENLRTTTESIACILCENPPNNPPFTPPAILPKERFALPCEPLYILPPV